MLSNEMKKGGNCLNFIHNVWSLGAALSLETTIPACLAALAAVLVDVGREGSGHKQTSTGLMSGHHRGNRDMSGGFGR